jgi:hypothetical protein
MQDSKDFLTEYTDFTDYLKKNLSWYEYENIHELLGFSSKILLTRLIAGTSITFWGFSNLLELFKLLENPILPSKLIERFDLQHQLSDIEIEALDDVAVGLLPNA